MSDDDFAGLIGTAVFVFVVVVLPWSACSTGGLYELRQMNPEHKHQEKSLAILVESAREGARHEAILKPLLEACSGFMPDWDEASDCLVARVECEEKHYGQDEWLRDDRKGIRPQSVADYFQCIDARVPMCGPICQLRVFRAWARSRVAAKLADGDEPDKETDPSLWRWANKGR